MARVTPLSKPEIESLRAALQRHDRQLAPPPISDDVVRRLLAAYDAAQAEIRRLTPPLKPAA